MTTKSKSGIALVVICASAVALRATALVRIAAANLVSVNAGKAIQRGSGVAFARAERASDVAGPASNDDALVMAALSADLSGIALNGPMKSRRASLALEGRRLWESGHRASAAETWRRAGISHLIVRLAALDDAAGRSQQALARYDQALAMTPASAPLWIAVGDLHERTKQWEAADAAYARAIAYAPADPRPYQAIAFARWRRGVTDAVTERAFGRAIEVTLADRQHRGDAGLPWLYTDLTLLHLRADRVALALSSGENAVRLGPSIPYAHFFLGEAYRLNREPRRAVAELNQALELGLKNEWARYSLAMALVDIGDVRAAETESERLRRDEPSFQGLATLEEHIQQAKLR